MSKGFNLSNLASSTIENLSSAVFGDDEAFSEIQDEDPDSAVGSSSGSARNGAQFLDSPDKRDQLYEELEVLLDDSVMNNALEIIADDAFGVKSKSNNIIDVEIDKSEEKEKEAEKFLKDKGIVDRARDVVMNAFLFGDEFWKLEAEEDKGVTSVNTSLHPKLFKRYEKDGELYGFGLDSDNETFKKAGKKYRKIRPPWDVIHIRSGVGAREKKERIPEDVHEGSYGRSGFRGILQDWKRLNLMENSMVLTRYQKSRRPTFYYIDTTGLKKSEREPYYNEVKEKVLNNSSFSENAETYREARELMAASEPIPHPIHEGDGKIEVQDESDSASADSIIDVEYQRNRMFGGIPVPSAYLGLEGELPSGIGQSTLITMSTRYARTVRRMQAQVLFAVQRLLRIHFAWKGEILKANEISVSTSSMTTAEDLTKAETAEKIAGAFQSVARTIDQVMGREDEWNNQPLLDEMFKKVDILSDLNPDELFNPDAIEDEAEEEELKKLDRDLFGVGSVLTKEDQLNFESQQTSLSKSVIDKIPVEEEHDSVTLIDHGS